MGKGEITNFQQFLFSQRLFQTVAGVQTMLFSIERGGFDTKSNPREVTRKMLLKKAFSFRSSILHKTSYHYRSIINIQTLNKTKKI